MLGAALAMLVLVSTFVAFGTWPGESTGKQIDQVLLNEVAGHKTAAKVAVGSAAIKANKRAEARRQIAIAREEKRSGKRSGDDRTITGDPLAKTPAGSAPTTAAGTPVASAPGDSSPVGTVRQQTQNVTQDVTQNLQQTTQDVTQNVTEPVQQTVDQTTTQVNQVVDQVVGGVEQTTSTTTQQVQSTVDTTTQTVTDTVGGVLGK
jgi:hypothetical protein